MGESSRIDQDEVDAFVTGSVDTIDQFVFGIALQVQQMMAGLSFESLLKKAGANVIPPEQIKAINDALQQFKKEQ